MTATDQTATGKTEIDAAVASVRDHFSGLPVEVVPDGAGGVYVNVSDVYVGDQYTPSTTWLGFQINSAYPHSDVYPHYIGPVSRTDGTGHGSAVQTVTWRERPALQLSRRSLRWNPTFDNAALKAAKVLTWFADQ